MAKTRLTVRLDEELIRRTRIYAESRGMTLNDFLREYLRKIAEGEIEPESKERLKSKATVHLRG
ncbi:DUF6364 family protein [Terracidiphilus sp.]|jgi:predicted DNA binding CopG/RHH family protein|uniref:DUF6364 family protein n=1 Tax=Terracidiphilus sp. TaxID=1964191 RepID=UPI003C784590